MPELVYLNGSLVSKNEAKISVMDRGFLFGDALYEVVRIYDNEAFCLEEHLDRFFFGVDGVNMPFPFTRAEFAGIIKDLIKQSNLGWASLYWEVSRGAYDPRTHYFTDDMNSPNVVMMTRQVGPQPAERRERGVKVISHPDLRWMKCCYKTVNLLPNCMARSKAHAAGALEAILYRNENHVTEGTASSVFIVKDGELWTHPEGDLILSSITRAEILKLCRKHGIPFKEKVFGLKDLFEADEVFTAATVAEINPVVMVDDNIIGSGKPGPLTKKIIDLYRHRTGQK